MVPIPYSSALDINARLLLLRFSVLTIFSIMCICKCMIHFACWERGRSLNMTLLYFSVQNFLCHVIMTLTQYYSRSTHVEIWRNTGLLIYLNFNHTSLNWIFSQLVNNLIAPACLYLLITLIQTCFKTAVKYCRKILPLVNFVFPLWRTLSNAHYHTIIQ